MSLPRTCEAQEFGAQKHTNLSRKPGPTENGPSFARDVCISLKAAPLWHTARQCSITSAPKQTRPTHRTMPITLAGSLHRPSESSDGSMPFADIFVIAITVVVWGLISICAATYYANLLRFESRRRWPLLKYDARLECVTTMMLFYFAFICWPGILLWDFSVRHCVAGKERKWRFGPGRCCAGCTPCISEEARKAAKEYRLETQARLQQGTIIDESPPVHPAMRIQSWSSASSMDDGDSFSSAAQVVGAKQVSPTRPGRAILPPPYSRAAGV
jgi:hypothetical protein